MQLPRVTLALTTRAWALTTDTFRHNPNLNPNFPRTLASFQNPDPDPDPDSDPDPDRHPTQVEKLLGEQVSDAAARAERAAREATAKAQVQLKVKTR